MTLSALLLALVTVSSPTPMTNVMMLPKQVITATSMESCRSCIRVPKSSLSWAPQIRTSKTTSAQSLKHRSNAAASPNPCQANQQPATLTTP